MKKTSLFLLTLATALTARAENLTLSAVIQESLQNSPEVQKAQSAAREATWKRRESYAGFLPSLSANATYLTSKRYMLINVPFNGNTIIFPTIIPTADYTLTAEWPIFDGFASTDRWRSSSRLESAAERLRAQPELSITEVAFDYGFNDSAYFSRCFRHRFGARPRDWRRSA